MLEEVKVDFMEKELEVSKYIEENMAKIYLTVVILKW